MIVFFLSAGTLWKREIVRFLRQRSRIIGALGQPILLGCCSARVLASPFARPARAHPLATSNIFIRASW